MAQSISDLPVGAKVYFGTHFGVPIVWVIAEKGHSGYPENSVTLVTDKMIRYIYMDNAEPSNKNSDRQASGNNNYAVSNIRQWLNSAGAAGAWYTAKHSKDASPIAGQFGNDYLNSDGFLRAFSAQEQNAILPTSYFFRKPDYDGGGEETLTDKVFIPSAAEIGLATDWQSSVEGSLIEWFESQNNLRCTGTAEAAKNNNSTVWSIGKYWMVRTAESEYAENSYAVYMDGAQFKGRSAANSPVGLRPLCNLSKDTKVSDTADSSGIYTLILNSPPTAPNGITVPSTVEGDKTLAVSWGAATDPDKNLAGYRLERKADTGTWTQIYQGTLQTFTDTITFGWGTVTYRVKAYDQEGAESGYTTSQARTVSNNRAPTISGSDGSIGTFSASFTAQSYTVNDADSDTVTVVETLDGMQLRSYKPTLGKANSLTFTADAWRNIRNGTHTLVITATDSKGAKAVRTWTFIKAQNTLTFTLSAPLSADSQPLRCIVTVLGTWPSGSTLKVEVCNNANDASPTWENITSKVLAGQAHNFTNSAKTASTWAVNVRVTLTRGSASGDCYIESVSGNFA